MNKAKQLEKAVKDFLQWKQYDFHRVENYRCFKCGQVQNSGAKGFPDFFVYSPFILAIECKTGSGRLTKEQKQVRNKMLKTGIGYIVCRDNIDELIKYQGDKMKKTIETYYHSESFTNLKNQKDYIGIRVKINYQLEEYDFELYDSNGFINMFEFIGTEKHRAALKAIDEAVGFAEKQLKIE